MNTSPLEILAFIFLGLALLMGLWRLLQGPTVPDRVVAADTLAIITTTGLAWLASAMGHFIYLDIALVYGALAFVGVVVIARAMEAGRDAD